ncbi:MAG: hypothetical protein JWL69_496 [Phycisphaerales bacterium]|nr:hypothetical protein [Phycisphaerales bacterium]MDB5354616.1 hypothetical protein [Phycisphaerales bacterium]
MTAKESGKGLENGSTFRPGPDSLRKPFVGTTAQSKMSLMRKTRMRTGTLLSILGLVAVAFLLLAFPEHAFGRAGGGEGYHGSGGGGGGGGGHGGGGGGGGGNGGLIWLLFQLVFRYPVVGIPLLIIVIALFYYYGRNNSSGGGGIVYSHAPALDATTKADAIARVRQHDPNFDEAAFYQRVRLAFGKIQDAWSAQKLGTVRPFISDGVYERFLLQFAEQKSEGWRDQMDAVQVHDVAVAELRSDGLYDELSVRIRASASDYRVSLADGKPIAGSAAPGQFVEIWSFLRRRGTLTQANRAGLIEGNCPNCGAPVELNQAANCTHCKALLRSGEYDWVLSEITQESEWEGARHALKPGVEAMRSSDADFNAVEMEDRASVMFWRKATADRLGKIDPLRKVASEPFCQTYGPQLRPAGGGQRSFYGKCAVGSVSLLGVLGDAQGDRAVVEVRWTGTLMTAVPGQPPKASAGEQTVFSLFVLWRQPGSKTDAGKGISSAHCPSCGAPASGGASNACDFCGCVLNDGAHGWVLADVTYRSDNAGQQLLEELGVGT